MVTPYVKMNDNTYLYLFFQYIDSNKSYEGIAI